MVAGLNHISSLMLQLCLQWCHSWVSPNYTQCNAEWML